MDIMSITESPEYDFWSFMSTLGGSMSLFLGITLVSSMEFVELLFRVLYFMLQSKSKRAKQIRGLSETEASQLAATKKYWTSIKDGSHFTSAILTGWKIWQHKFDKLFFSKLSFYCYKSNEKIQSILITKGHFFQRIQILNLEIAKFRI